MKTHKQIIKEYLEEVKEEADRNKHHFASYQYFTTKIETIKEILKRIK